MEFNTEMTIDLQEVKDYVESPKFTRFLLDSTPSFECAAFVLQALLDAVEQASQTLDNPK